ncbi:hypothetical protein NM208_g2811 [Fusarium decemcellulare]|uniref:Uncharacterized protein n=1 Tax=Fusarium decemcellulare TaxID=57161 RepID=A0ACC1SRF4_9HYPO|nr:hypothetical protein NM208_g2811 [Fusarium decemcellulare]
MSAQLELSDVEFMTRGFRQRSIIVFGICYSFAGVAVILRFLSRRIAHNKFWWDDWLAPLGLVVTGGFCACVMSSLPSDELLDGKQKITNALLIRGAQGAYAAELFYYINQLSLKFSVLCFYWRVFSSSNYISMSIRIIGGVIILWLIASFIVAVLQCVPVQANWDPVAKAQPGLKCVDLNGFFFGTSIPNILADLVLVLLPIPQVIQLKITTTQKVFVIMFFFLGGFVVITSIVRLKLITQVNFATFAVNWSMDDSVVWTIVENCCGVISVCLPSLRPIVKFLPWRFIQDAFTRSYGTGKDSKNRSRTTNSMFNRSLYQSQWSEITSTRGDLAEPSRGIKKDTRFDVVSIEMNSKINSSRDQLAGSSSS